MSLQLRHDPGAVLELRWGDVVLVRYVYRDAAPREESPKPYLHPLRTLAGELVTDYRPPDHVWHKGVQMTIERLDGENFWGGDTYVHGRGYVPRRNHGTIAHQDWELLACDGERATLSERLTWIAGSGQPYLSELRTLELRDVDPDAGSWILRARIRLRNVAGRALEWGTPATAGRRDAGYGGLFWRGPRSFTGGEVMTPAGHGAEDAMGRRAPWLAFVGRHDGNDRASTLLLCDDPRNPRYPTKWFVRSTPFPCACFALVFDEPLTLAAGGTLDLRYAIVIGAGAWARERIEARANELLESRDEVPARPPRT